MRKLLSSLLLLAGALVAPFAVAQTATTPYSSPAYYASSFNLWSINSQAPNTYTFQGRSLCNSSAQGVNFFVFNTNAPVYIADSNTAESELVTPSAVVNTAGSCGVTLSPSNTHSTFQLRSGTAGLQEAINTVKASGGWPALILLDRNWWSTANNLPGTNGNTVITSTAKGNAGALLQDITASPAVTYVWNGTAYASGTWVNTAPGIAAGAAAGTAPTVSNSGTSTALSGIANVTAGTATTTGTLFTETAAANTINYAASCTVTSVGANSFTAFTVATSVSSGHNLLTVTATSAPTASTAYQFAYNCK